MNESIDDAIKAMTEKVKSEGSADHAMKFAQAALNLAYAKQVLGRIGTE